MQKVKFLWESIKNFKVMGTVIQSGPSMCKKMVQHIHKEGDLIIVELGAGDGVITKYLLEKMSSNAKLFVFEINPKLCEIISKIDDKRMFLINNGAQNMESELKKYNITQVDTIISAIPFLVLPQELTQEILSISKKMLKPEGYFVQMHYVKRISEMYKEIFGNVTISYVPLNIPPGYVFRSRNSKV